jgi:hypothetical protein
MVAGASADRSPSGARRVTTAVVSGYRRHRFAWLFASLLLTLGAGPTLHAVAARYNPLAVLLALNLLAAIASVAREGAMRLPLVLGGAFVAARVVQAVLGVPGMLEISDGLWLVALVLATVTSVRTALAAGAVDAERILAALDAYLLAGLIFGAAYWMLERAWPGSFGGGGFDLPHAMYFSFVTIASLGYGDLVPVSEPARGLAILEAVSGQMYMTVLVARLVSLYSQAARD